ncbi:gluconate 2-dehydrogenase subunit 3 family protein [uncultured Jannaschia sp.]|uniref:gluconate 2-dehydrogenase subunit 3 family protein n=1 Tax=uncultured Jannaschia sp. TaxID=293347 RepID=UPI0026181B9C|nr:gluconate 2-dehydrogenase subunit 3 family protein [uncultured Jannaschia sp.]
MPGTDPRRDRFPGYDVTAKRDTPSWNAKTRAVVDERLAIDPEAHRFFDTTEWRTLRALCDRIVPQPADRPGRVSLAAMVDAKAGSGKGDGYRNVKLPPLGAAWRRALAALEAEANARHGHPFSALPATAQDELIEAMRRGDLHDLAWGDMPPDLFFQDRVVPDVVKSYYAHPTAWSEIGFGGPASPRGYVRLGPDRQDPWEAHEDHGDGHARPANERIGR